MKQKAEQPPILAFRVMAHREELVFGTPKKTTILFRGGTTLAIDGWYFEVGKMVRYNFAK